MRFMAFDCETGGLGTEHSLLTAYFIVFGEDFKPLGELHLRVKPEDEMYCVTAEALAINKINLIEHDRTAITTAQASKELYDFLNRMSDGGAHRLIPVGQNEPFDEMVLFAHLIKRKTWKNFVSYHCLDTGQLANFFKVCGLMPISQKTSLGNLAEFFGIPTGELHDAKEDTVVCVKVLRKMITRIKELRDGR